MVQAPDNVKGNVRGLAVRFDLGQGATIDLVMISAPVFFVKTPALRWSNWVRPRLRR
jgi:catalase